MGQRGYVWALTFSLLSSTAFAECSQDTLSIKGQFGSAKFAVSVADTADERAQGLMFVEQMPRMAGMLFVYEQPSSVAFWMKNTLIPLDMIFADENGVVQSIHENAIPGDLTAIPGGDNIQYVLELNAGVAKMLGLKPDNVMQHPAIEKAAWPCE